MDFIISSAELLKGLMDVVKAIPTKSALPILENFLFVLKGDSLEVSASDQELTLRTVIKVDSPKEEGSIAVPARHITDLLKVIPDQPVRIKTVSDASFECAWSNGQSSLPYFPADDYPEISNAGDDARTIVFPAAELLDGINGTVYAAADDEMRPALNGVFFDVEETSTTLVASDQHKLICFTATDVTSPEKTSFILHKKAASVLKSIISKEDETVEIIFDAKTIVFKFGQTMMVCRPVVGKFPKYRDVIPQNNSNILKIDRLQFLNTIRRVAVCSNKATNSIKFDLKEGQLEITAQDLGFALSAYEKLQCEYNGADLTIGFKSSFLVDILSNMDCETVVMKFAEFNRAALIVPSEEEAAEVKVCGLIMPIIIS